MKKMIYLVFLVFSALVYSQNQAVMTASDDLGLVFWIEPFNPEIHTSTGVWPVFTHIEDSDKGNVLNQDVEEFHKTNIHASRTYIAHYAISPDGKQIVYELGYYHVSTRFEDEPTTWRNYHELYHYKIGDREPLLIGKTGSFKKDILHDFAPRYWLDNTKILLEAVMDGTPNPLGILVYDLEAKQGQLIPINSRYIETPIANEEGSLLFYYVEGGSNTVNIDQMEGEKLMYVYDMNLKSEIQVFQIPTFVTNQIVVRDLRANGCILSGSPTYALPWTCNKAMCVERDGPQYCPGSNCNMSGYDMNVEYSDCGLNPGSNYTWGCNSCPTQTCGHNRPAIDFGDAGLWFQTGTPVLASANGVAQQRFQSSGAGKYVIIRSPRTGGGYAYSYYMHLSSVTSTIPNEPSWISVQKGNQIGLEGNTGTGGGAPHYHFELKDAIGNNNSYYPKFQEYGVCTPKTGRTYISRNVPTDGSMQNGFDCNAVTTISCNTTLANQSNVGSASRYATYGKNGSYHSWDEYGPEKIYKLTTTQTGTISVVLSNVVYNQGNDLDVFILKNSLCSNLDPLVDTKSNTSGLTATYTNAPAGTYFIIVDGSNGSAGTFTISVSGPCSGQPNLTDNGSTRSVSGRNITITTRVINNGNTNAGTFKTRYYLSYDIAFGNDYVLGTLNYTNGLPAGSSNTFTYTWPVPSNVPGGTYYLLEHIDYSYLVAESNENDNAFYWPTPITLPPPSFTGDIVFRSEPEVIVEDLSTYVSAENSNDITDRIVSLTDEGKNQISSCQFRIQGNEILGENIPINSEYQIVDIAGRIQCHGITVIKGIECTSLLPGIYFVSIKEPDGNICVQKFIVK